MTTPPPLLTNLLFGVSSNQYVSGGFIEPNTGHPVIIGGYFVPDCWRLMPLIELAASDPEPEPPQSLAAGIRTALAAAIRAELSGIARYDENLYQLAGKLGILL